MADLVPGPLGIPNPHCRGLFDLFVNDDSHEEDNFPDALHVSDDSESESESDSDDSPPSTETARSRDLDLREPSTNCWIDVTLNEDCDNFPHSFTVREAKGPTNIPAECEKPVDFFQLFVTDTLLRTISEETNWYADNFVHTSEIAAWIENHLHFRYREWPICVSYQGTDRTYS